MAPVEPADSDIPTAPGDDATAGLLLALTALYVQRSNHTSDEQQQYTELALRLIDKVGAATRAVVAARLQRQQDAPSAVIERLGGAQFPPNGIEAGQFHSAAGLTPEFGEAFFAASAVERRRMLSEMATTDADPGNGRRFHMRIDIAPWQSRTGAFARDFKRLIDAPRSLCERILNDPSGEPMVIAARATGMPVAILQRILLLVSPATHHSVQRVYELTELYHSLDGRTARALLAVWRSAAKPNDKQAPGPITNLRARLGALDARIQSHASREGAQRSVPPASSAGEGGGGARPQTPSLPTGPLP